MRIRADEPIGSRSLQREHDTQQGNGEVGNAQDPGAA